MSEKLPTVWNAPAGPLRGLEPPVPPFDAQAMEQKAIRMELAEKIGPLAAQGLLADLRACLARIAELEQNLMLAEAAYEHQFRENGDLQAELETYKKSE